MTNDELILQKLTAIESELARMKAEKRPMDDLVEELTPISKQALYVLIKEFEGVESAFELGDLVTLSKKFLRNVKNLTYALETLETMLDLWHTVEPLLKNMVHTGVRTLGAMEAKGVFRTYEAMIEVRGKVAQAYGPEDIAAMGDSFVQLIGLLKKMSNPEMLNLLDKLTDLPANLHLDQAKPVGPLGMAKVLMDPEIKQGLGVAMELTKALGKLK